MASTNDWVSKTSELTMTEISVVACMALSITEPASGSSTKFMSRFGLMVRLYCAATSSYPDGQ